MADVTYILGTGEYVRVEISDDSLDESWSPTGWSFELCLVPRGAVYDAAVAVWAAAAYEAVTDTSGKIHHTVVAHLEDLTQTIGIYIPRVMMTHGTDAESPVPIKARGKVTVER
jgi:hypothetical protein